MKLAITLTLLMCLLSLPALAQVTGVATLQGVVTDGSDAALANAEVTVTNLDTGVAVKATTNETGLYRVPALNPGRYSVEAKANGFAAARVNETRLEVGQTARLDFSLKIGNVSETVEVTSQATLLNSETTDVGQVIDGKRIVEMPLNGRNYLQLAQLTAGGLTAGHKRPPRGGGLFALSAGPHYKNKVLGRGADHVAPR